MLRQFAYINLRGLSQPLTGVQRFAIEISRHLVRLETRWQILCPRQGAPRAEALSLPARAIGRFSGQLWEQWELPRYLKEKGTPLLINLANSAPVGYPNQVVTVHDLAVFRYPECFSPAFRLFYRWMIPRVVQRAKHVFTVSEFSRAELQELLKVPREKITVVPNAVAEVFRTAPLSPHGVENWPPFILGVGSRDPRKNTALLIEAFRLLDEPDLHLFLVGQDSPVYPSSVDWDRLSAHPRIRFLGAVSDETLARLYREAKIFVYPSRYEGFGLPPLEAMACGTPVIVTRRGALPEVCAEAALYVEPEEPAVLARAIRRLLHDAAEQERLRNLGWKNVQRFSWESSARRMWEAILSLQGVPEACPEVSE